MTSLESRHYVATDHDIVGMTHGVLAARAADATARQTFLRALIGTAQAELSLPGAMTPASASPGKGASASRSRLERSPASLAERPEKPAEPTSAQPAPSEQEIARAALAVVEAVYARFYAVVVEVLAKAPVDPDETGAVRLPGGRRATRKAIIQRRATFARSAKSVLRSWLRAGGDLHTLNAARASKGALMRDIARWGGKASARRAAARRGRKLAPIAAVLRRVREATGTLAREVHELARFDPEQAAALARRAMAALAAELEAIGGHERTTSDLQRAIAEDRPLRVARGQVVRLVRAEPLAERGGGASSARLQ